jgi:hypothetical protein
MDKGFFDGIPLIVLALLALAVLLVVGLIGVVITGAIKMARCENYEWVMVAVIVSMLPLGYHFFVSVPLGAWALMVLRRPEVQAAFVLSLRRAQRTGQRPTDVPVPLPTGPGKQPARGFFRSVLSMFVSQPPISHQTTTGEAAFLSSPPGRLADPVAGVRQRWGLWLGIGVAACALIAVVIFFGSGMGKAPQIVFRPKTETSFEAILVGDIDDLKRTLPLYNDQPEVLKMVFRRAEQEYLEIELRHTSRTVNAERHLLVTIRPFSEEVSQLEERVWAKLNAIFTMYNQQGAAQKQLPARGMLFPFGKGKATLEIWEDGSWYYWKVARDAETQEEGNGTQLPRRYQRFWQGGPP